MWKPANPFCLTILTNREKFAGREKETEEILDTLHDVSVGISRHIVIYGPRGLGKSSLARMVDQLIRAEGKYASILVQLDGSSGAFSEVIAEIVRKIDDNHLPLLGWCQRQIVRLPRIIPSFVRKCGFKLQSAKLGPKLLNLNLDPSIYGSCLVEEIKQCWNHMHKKYQALAVILDGLDLIDDKDIIQLGPTLRGLMESLTEAHFARICIIVTLLESQFEEVMRGTDRAGDKSVWRGFNHIKLKPMAPKESRELINKALKTCKPTVEIDPDVIEAIAKYSSGFPAITQRMGYYTFLRSSDLVLDWHDFEGGWSKIREGLLSFHTDVEYRNALIRIEEAEGQEEEADLWALLSGCAQKRTTAIQEIARLLEWDRNRIDKKLSILKDLNLIVMIENAISMPDELLRSYCRLPKYLGPPPEPAKDNPTEHRPDDNEDDEAEPSLDDMIAAFDIYAGKYSVASNITALNGTVIVLAWNTTIMPPENPDDLSNEEYQWYLKDIAVTYSSPRSAIPALAQLALCRNLSQSSIFKNAPVHVMNVPEALDRGELAPPGDIAIPVNVWLLTGKHRKCVAQFMANASMSDLLCEIPKSAELLGCLVEANEDMDSVLIGLISLEEKRIFVMLASREEIQSIAPVEWKRVCEDCLRTQ